MIRKIHRRRFTGIVAMLALSGWLAGCGFKGPLYLPPPKPAAAKPAPAAPAASSSVPAAAQDPAAPATPKTDP